MTAWWTVRLDRSKDTKLAALLRSRKKKKGSAQTAQTPEQQIAVAKMWHAAATGRAGAAALDERPAHVVAEYGPRPTEFGEPKS